MKLSIFDVRVTMGSSVIASALARAAVLGVVVLASTLFCSTLHAELLDRLLAVVAGDLITLSDVTAARDLGLVSAGQAPDPIRAILTQLIDRELILAEVDRYSPPEPTTEAIDSQVAQIRARFPSDAAFEAALAQSGIDTKHLHETARENLRMQYYLDQRFTVPTATEDELVRYYRAHEQTFTRGGAVLPFDQARLQVVQAWAADRRKTMVDEWVAGLRRRADIIDLYIAGR